MYDSHYNTIVEDEKEMTLSDYLQTNEYTKKIFARYNFKVTVVESTGAVLHIVLFDAFKRMC